MGVHKYSSERFSDATHIMSAHSDSNSWEDRGQQLRSLQEVFFSLNVACALAYAVCLYVARSFNPSAAASAWQNDSGYYFLRGAVRVSDLLHRAFASPVSTSAVARRDSVLWSSGTIALTVLATIWSAAAVIHMLVRVLASRSGSGTLFRRIAGPVALFAAPTFCVFTWQITSNWENDDSTARTPLGHNTLLWMLVGELVCFAAFSLLTHKREFSGWWALTTLLVHFVFWAAVLFSNFIFYIGESRARLLIHITTWLIPSAGAALLLYVWPGARAVFAPGGKIGNWPIITAAIGATILSAVWLPRRSHDSIPTSASRSATVGLSRGPCFGSCPVYTVTIHGDGNVEFDGKQSVKIHGKQTAQITDAQFAQVIGVLNRVRFSDLDDRAFSWCFDTPAVSIAVTTSGHEKRVSSDVACTGAKAGMQAEFVRATDEIENIVSTDRWVKCDGQRCR